MHHSFSFLVFCCFCLQESMPRPTLHCVYQGRYNKTPKSRGKQPRRCGATERRGDLGWRQDDPAPFRVPDTKNRCSIQAHIFNSGCEPSGRLLAFGRYFPNILFWEFSNLQWSWNHFVANIHIPAPCILWLVFYSACFIPGLSIYPSLHLSINSWFWCISK